MNVFDSSAKPGPAQAIIAIFSTMFFSAGATGQDIHTGAHTLIEIAPHIYVVVPEFAGAAAALIFNADSVIVIDSHASPASAATLVDAVKELTDKPIRYVINTHWHVDHHSGNSAYLENFPGQVSFIAHDHTREDIPTLGRQQFAEMAPYLQMPLDSAAEQLQSGTDARGDRLTEKKRATVEKFHAGQEEFLASTEQFEFSLPNLTIDRALTIHDDRYTVEVMFLYPAHTRGDLVVYVPEQKILMAGDLLTKPILWTWSSYPRDYVRTLLALEKLDIEKIVIGHGGPVLEGTSYLTSTREAMETLVAFSTQARTAGLSVEQAVEKSSSDDAIQNLRQRFVTEDEEENRMFDQMIGWTIDRAYQEMDAI